MVTDGLAKQAAADKKQTFQAFLGSLPIAQRETFTESYLHYVTAERKWNAKPPAAPGPKPLLGIAGASIKRIQQVQHQSARLDRIHIARAYLEWLDERKAAVKVTSGVGKAAQVTDKVHCPASKAAFIRQHMRKDETPPANKKENRKNK